MPPIVSVVGKSKSGKTTLIEKLIQELKSRGYRVATIKHIPQGVSFDEPGKDSWRHLQAGSEAASFSSTHSQTNTHSLTYLSEREQRLDNETQNTYNYQRRGKNRGIWPYQELK